MTVTETKNICTTINSLVSGGAENQCILSARALNPHHKVTVVVLNPKIIYEPRLELLKQGNIDYVVLAKNPLKRYRVL